MGEPQNAGRASGCDSLLNLHCQPLAPPAGDSGPGGTGFGPGDAGVEHELDVGYAADVGADALAVAVPEVAAAACFGHASACETVVKAIVAEWRVGGAGVGEGGEAVAVGDPDDSAAAAADGAAAAASRQAYEEQAPVGSAVARSLGISHDAPAAQS